MWIWQWTSRFPKKLTLAQALEQRRAEPKRGRSELPDAAREETRKATVWEVVTHHASLALAGNPGSGKSTVGQFLTVVLSRAQRGIHILDRLPGWSHGALLPVPVVLRHYAAALDPAQPGNVGTFWALFGQQLEKEGKEAAWAGTVKRVAASHGALFLLDGWDETSDLRRLARMAEMIVDLRKKAGTKCRFLLTSRPYAWEIVTSPDDAALTKAFPNPTDRENAVAAFRALHATFADCYTVAPFDDSQIERFIGQWYEATRTVRHISEAQQKRDDLKVAARRPDLRPVVENPLLLTLTASLSGKRLPDDRTDLFSGIVELLLQQWTRASGGTQTLQQAIAPHTLQMQHLREKIEKCAFDAHRGNVDTPGAADIPETALEAAIAPLLGGSKDLADVVISFIEQRAGLLIGKGLRGDCRQFSCPHRTFQEYLAGCHLQKQREFTTGLSKELSAASLSRASAGHWREVLCFAAREAGSIRGSDAADALVHSHDFNAWTSTRTVEDADWRSAVNAAKMLREIGIANLTDDVEKASLERVRGWLIALIERNGLADSPRERVDAALDLAALAAPGELGDLRPGVGCREGGPDFAWVKIAGGKFQMGETAVTKRYDDEMPRFDCGLVPQDFHIAKYPVTVAQFAAFIADGGYQDDAFWTAGRLQGADGPERYGDIFQTPNHPQVGVSWYEAMAFCKWASRKTGRDIRLPSEAQWERAARGTTSRTYPWGEAAEKELAANCNYSGTGLGHTSAVGLFPGGATLEGVCDMAGNVWEWCSTKWRDNYRDYEKHVSDAESGNESRLLRGGSWSSHPDNVRAASRLHDDPGGRNHCYGFRVVCVGECR